MHYCNENCLQFIVCLIYLCLCEVRNKNIFVIADKMTIFFQFMLHLVPESRRKRKYTQRIDEMFPRPGSKDETKNIKTASITSDKYVL